MPITLSCPCGKTLRVADEHAGKRVKCPACTTVVTAPKPEPEPQFEVIEDEPARPLVASKPAVKARADEDDEGGGYGLKPAEKTAPVPTPKPEFRRRAADDGEERPRKKKKKGGTSRAAARRAGAEAGRRLAYTVGGGFGALLGTGLTLWGNSGDGRSATKMMIFGAIIGVCGLVSLIQGLTGNLPDEEGE